MNYEHILKYPHLLAGLAVSDRGFSHLPETMDYSRTSTRYTSDFNIFIIQRGTVSAKATEGTSTGTVHQVPVKKFKKMFFNSLFPGLRRVRSPVSIPVFTLCTIFHIWQDARIRTRDAATAARFATNALHTS